MTSRLFCRRITHHVSQSIALRKQSTPATTTAAAQRYLATFKPSILLNESVTMKVPTMGDSITEGTIVEWAAEVGQAVKEGDVIALVETDKVTIDIKAEFDGVIVEHCGEVEDNVEVGADLYKIDTEATATVTADASAADPAPVEAAPTTSASASVTEEKTEAVNVTGQVRVPSIQFLGKDGWKKKLSIVGESITQKPPSTAGDPLKPNGAITLQCGQLSPTYGRLPFSEREIEALIMGGASEVE